MFVVDCVAIVVVLLLAILHHKHQDVIRWMPNNHSFNPSRHRPPPIYLTIGNLPLNPRDANVPLSPRKNSLTTDDGPPRKSEKRRRATVQLTSAKEIWKVLGSNERQFKNR